MNFLVYACLLSFFFLQIHNTRTYIQSIFSYLLMYISLLSFWHSLEFFFLSIQLRTLCCCCCYFIFWVHYLCHFTTHNIIFESVFVYLFCFCCCIAFHRLPYHIYFYSNYQKNRTHSPCHSFFQPLLCCIYFQSDPNIYVFIKSPKKYKNKTFTRYEIWYLITWLYMLPLNKWWKICIYWASYYWYFFASHTSLLISINLLKFMQHGRYMESDSITSIKLLLMLIAFSCNQIWFLILLFALLTHISIFFHHQHQHHLHWKNHKKRGS